MGPIQFIEENLVVPRGPLAGKPFILLPWQKEVLQDLYGDGGIPIIGEYYISTPKKNAKTSLSAVIMLYHLIGEPNEVCAEICSAAASEEQAKLIWKTAKQIVLASPKLKHLVDSGRLEIYRDRMLYQAKNGERTYKALTTVADTSEGKDISLLLLDEIHAIRGAIGREFIDTLVTATAGRANPLIIYTTTAGYDLTTYCYDIERRIEKIEQGVAKKSEGFGYKIHRAPKTLPWDSEEAFKAANPSYGTLISHKYFRQRVAQAKQSPTFRRAYCRYHLNQWTENADAFIDMEEWKKCGVNDENFDWNLLEGRDCFGGLDLSHSADLTSFSLLFLPTEEDPYYRVVSYNFLPEEDHRNKELKDGVPYFSWAKQGFLDFLPGRVIDPDYIVDKIREARSMYNILAMAYDPWDSKEVIKALDEDGMTLVEFKQHYQYLSPPTKKLLDYVISRKLKHNNNHVLTWNISNLIVMMDPNGNIKPDKRRSKEKIDAAVSLIMALGCSLAAPESQPFVSAYETGVGTFKSVYAVEEEEDEQAEAV